MTRKRIITLAAVGALATVSTVAISMSSWMGASAADDATGDYIRLHIPSNAPANFTYEGAEQVLAPARSACDVQTNGTLIKLTSEAPGGKSKPGIANFGLGVKASPSSGNGNPCAQTDTTETLILEPGSPSAVTGRSFDKVRLDLEMTGNAIVVLTVSGPGHPAEPFKLQTGTSINATEKAELSGDPTPNEIETDSSDAVDACAAFNSSNPNSGGSDNCLWTVDPDLPFTKISLTTVERGTVALEGSSDFANDPGHDSLFFLAPRLLCGGQTVTDSDGGVNASFTMLAGPEVCKPFAFEADEVLAGENGQSSVLFQPVGATKVDYRGVISFGAETAPIGQLVLVLKYDPIPGDAPNTTPAKPVQWCTNPDFNSGGQVTSATIPAGETWCIADERTTGDVAAAGMIITTWQVWGHDDPQFLNR